MQRNGYSAYRTALALFLTVAACGAAHAAPLYTLLIQGRVLGDAGPFSNHILGNPGQVIEYRVLGLLNQGASNNQGGTVRTVSPPVAGDGANALKFDLFQSAADQNQLTFSSPATLVNGFESGTGAHGGTVTPRGNGNNDLLDVRPVQPAGVFANAADVARGQVTITSASGFSGGIFGRWSTGGSGSLRINGGTTVFVTATSESGPDPIIGYQHLHWMPEPNVLALTAIGGMALLRRQRRA